MVQYAHEIDMKAMTTLSKEYISFRLSIAVNMLLICTTFNTGAVNIY